MKIHDYSLLFITLFLLLIAPINAEVEIIKVGDSWTYEEATLKTQHTETALEISQGVVTANSSRMFDTIFNRNFEHVDEGGSSYILSIESKQNPENMHLTQIGGIPLYSDQSYTINASIWIPPSDPEAGDQPQLYESSHQSLRPVLKTDMEKFLDFRYSGYTFFREHTFSLTGELDTVRIYETFHGELAKVTTTGDVFNISRISVTYILRLYSTEFTFSTSWSEREYIEVEWSPQHIQPIRFKQVIEEELSKDALGLNQVPTLHIFDYVLQVNESRSILNISFVPVVLILIILPIIYLKKH
jgi:hypothetical protein